MCSRELGRSDVRRNTARHNGKWNLKHGNESCPCRTVNLPVNPTRLLHIWQRLAFLAVGAGATSSTTAAVTGDVDSITVHCSWVSTTAEDVGDATVEHNCSSICATSSAFPLTFFTASRSFSEMVSAVWTLVLVEPLLGDSLAVSCFLLIVSLKHLEQRPSVAEEP